MTDLTVGRYAVWLLENFGGLMHNIAYYLLRILSLMVMSVVRLYVRCTCVLRIVLKFLLIFENLTTNRFS